MESETVEFAIHPRTCLGTVSLAVSNLERALSFYVDVLGMRATRTGEHRVALGTGGAALLLLEAQPEVRPKPSRTTGLYHLALLLPTRRDLARAFHRLQEVRYPLQGTANHLVSEALYLADPEGNGVEIYADRPREAWPRHNDQVQMATNSLDLESLESELPGGDEPWTGLSPDTRIGHIHLQVADLRRAEAFYRRLLGFELTQRYGPSALFLAAGGYHHHIGLNSWAGPTTSPPVDAAGLRYFTICLPDRAELDRLSEHLRGAGAVFEPRDEDVFLRDPSGNGVLLSAACDIV